MQLFLHATWSPTGANHPGISHAGSTLDGRIGKRPNPHRQGLLQRFRIDRDGVKSIMLTMVRHIIFSTQATHNVKRLDKTGHTHLLRGLKGLVRLRLVSQATNHGGATTAHHIQHSDLLCQQNRLVERQEKQRDELHVTGMGRQAAHGWQHLQVVIPRDVVIPDGN